VNNNPQNSNRNPFEVKKFRVQHVCADGVLASHGLHGAAR
jgi:hypothetical protein